MKAKRNQLTLWLVFLGVTALGVLVQAWQRYSPEELPSFVYGLAMLMAILVAIGWGVACCARRMARKSEPPKGRANLAP
jgi:glucan phosphoethanolaminetransferase (alkaline phosphatase superfamily)